MVLGIIVGFAGLIFLIWGILYSKKMHKEEENINVKRDGGSIMGELLNLLCEIKRLIDSPNTDVLWSRYENVEDALSHLDQFKQRLELGDQKVISELKILFAPTGDLQEISLGSGWGGKFIELSSRFDHIIKSKF